MSKIISGAVLLLIISSVTSLFDLAVFHTNDVHSRFNERGAYEGSKCEKGKEGLGCFGGMPRHQTWLKENRNPHSLLLSGGDWFTGTTYFNVYQGNLTAHYIEALKYDVITIGNHEFDKGADLLASMLAKLTTTKVTVANMEVSKHPTLKNIVKPYILIDMDKDGNDDIGVIGYITPDTKYLSNPGDFITFSDPVQAVKKQADIIKRMGINKIIALGHAGIEIDSKICGEVSDVDIAVGGHTNTFLWNGNQPSNEEIEGPYPKLFEKNNHKCLVVQAFAYGKYMGNLKVTFDDAGEITKYSGNPVLMDRKIEEDKDMITELNKFSEKVISFSKIVVGSAGRDIEGSRIACRQRECELGNIIADAYLQEYKITRSDETVRCAIINGGSIRSYIQKGDITFEDLLTVMPFGNTVNRFTAKGSVLKDAFEHSVSAFIKGNNTEGRYLQVAGVHVVYNIWQPAGSRVKELKIEVNDGNFEDVEDGKSYNCISPNYLLAGGDGFTMLKNQDSSPVDPKLDIDVFRKFIEEHKPLDIYDGLQHMPSRSFFRISDAQRRQFLANTFYIVICFSLLHMY